MLSLLHVVLALVVVGILLWALGQFPVDPTIAKLVRVLVIVCAAFYALHALFGFNVPGLRR